MTLTILLAIMMMVGLFLMLLSGVGFIQDKRFFTSGPRRCWMWLSLMVNGFRELMRWGGSCRDIYSYDAWCNRNRCCRRNTGRLWICSVLRTLFNNASFIKSLRYLVL